ncbi:hypothetical protein BD410DRAFT_530926 [Rickenella mellea]|uniref:Uncharacterized protein n=1 Tax=Rickenella mellea TaxID=50990 RepID=A0A4Y7QHU0_9AGAM|nr:hypothetical protein BD410DRAFT_530926 [Rickenella mellea]
MFMQHDIHDVLAPEEWDGDPTEDGPQQRRVRHFGHASDSAQFSYSLYYYKVADTTNQIGTIRTSLLRVDDDIKSFSLILPFDCITTFSPIKLSDKNQTLAAALYGTDVLPLAKRKQLFRADPNISKLSADGTACQCTGCKCNVRIVEEVAEDKEFFVILAWQIHCITCEPLQALLAIDLENLRQDEAKAIAEQKSRDLQHQFTLKNLRVAVSDAKKVASSQITVEGVKRCKNLTTHPAAERQKSLSDDPMVKTFDRYVVSCKLCDKSITLGGGKMHWERHKKLKHANHNIETTEVEPVAERGGCRRTPDQRQKLLEEDQLLDLVKPGRVHCVVCNIWVTLDKRGLYSMSHWIEHKTKYHGDKH